MQFSLKAISGYLIANLGIDCNFSDFLNDPLVTLSLAAIYLYFFNLMKSLLLLNGSTGEEDFLISYFFIFFGVSALVGEFINTFRVF